MSTIPAHYFDGRGARLHEASLDVRAGMLHVVSPGIERSVPLADVRLAEPFAQAPAMLRLPDGACCEVPAGPGRQALLDAIGYRKSRIERWQEHSLAALAALVLLVALLALGYFRGVPLLADRIAAMLPASVETRLGQTALATLEKQELIGPSALGEDAEAEVEALLAKALPPNPRRPARVLLRSSKLGANALTLPDGTIVVTDALLEQMGDDGHDADDEDLDDSTHDAGIQARIDASKTRLLAVLAHEVGHLERRHTARALAGSSLSAALSAALFGDFSTVAAGVPALLVNMHYSRAMELEADDYAVAVLRRNHASPLALAQALEALQDTRDPLESALPDWMRSTLSYLSTHPDTEERIARACAAAK